jgi:hypothetical protein
MAGNLEYPIGTEPTVGQQRSPTQLASRFSYLLSVLNALVGEGEYSFPDAASAGTTNKILRSNGDGTTSWTTLSQPTAWEIKTGNFTAANGGRYLCTSGVSSIALGSPSAGDEFWFKPQIGNSLVTNPIAFTGTPQIAGVASTAYSANENVLYRLVSNGTDFDISAEFIDR